MTYLNSLFSLNGSMNPDDWFQIPHKKKLWIIQIREKGKREPFKVFQAIQNKDILSYYHYCLERFAKLILGREKRSHHNIASKCRACRYYSQCSFKV